MQRRAMQEVIRVLQTPVLVRSMFRFTIRDVIFAMTIVALVISLLIERKQHAATKKQLMDEKSLLAHEKNLMQLLDETFPGLRERYERETGTTLAAPP